MRLYLDICCIQRPLDDDSQPRIRSEAVAFASIYAEIKSGTHALVSSQALMIEAEQNTDAVRAAYVRRFLDLASESVLLSDEVRARAQVFGASGLKRFDASHVAGAEAGRADYFATVDDKLLRRARRIETRVRVVSLLALVEELRS